MRKTSSTYRIIAVGLLLVAAGVALSVRLEAARHTRVKVLGLKQVIAFTYSPTKYLDIKQLHSATLVGPVAPGEWKYWQAKAWSRASATRGLTFCAPPLTRPWRTWWDRIMVETPGRGDD